MYIYLHTCTYTYIHVHCSYTKPDTSENHTNNTESQLDNNKHKQTDKMFTHALCMNTSVCDFLLLNKAKHTYMYI